MSQRADISLCEAVHTRKPVAGLSHSFYRYPARFSPLFVRAAVEAFTKPGDVVFDPFMGGGTTLVEASAAGRSVIGTDINSLAVFVSKAKTTVLAEEDLATIRIWGYSLMPALNLHRPHVPPIKWAELGYQRNLTGRNTWAIRKLLELALAQVDDLRKPKQRRFARCVLLKTAQWALDYRKTIPSAAMFRAEFLWKLEQMLEGARTSSESFLIRCDLN